VNLKSVHLNDNRIQDISALGRLQELCKLHVSCNRISQLPILSGGLFYHLQIFDASYNFIPADVIFSCASEWSRLPCLRHLDLSGNDLQQLPKVMGSFPSLQLLRLDQNALTGACLQALNGLPRLEHLTLTKNRIQTIPANTASKGSFPVLCRLDLSHNNLRNGFLNGAMLR
jgi:Leucine-rich repeat (LRR) protein